MRGCGLTRIPCFTPWARKRAPRLSTVSRRVLAGPGYGPPLGLAAGAELAAHPVADGGERAAGVADQLGDGVLALPERLGVAPGGFARRVGDVGVRVVTAPGVVAAEDPGVQPRVDPPAPRRARPRTGSAATYSSGISAASSAPATSASSLCIRPNWRSSTRIADPRNCSRTARSLNSADSLRIRVSKPRSRRSATRAPLSAGCSQARELISGRGTRWRTGSESMTRSVTAGANGGQPNG